jgi:hypothetical protein
VVEEPKVGIDVIVVKHPWQKISMPASGTAIIPWTILMVIALKLNYVTQFVTMVITNTGIIYATVVTLSMERVVANVSK